MDRNVNAVRCFDVRFDCGKAIGGAGNQMKIAPFLREGARDTFAYSLRSTGHKHCLPFKPQIHLISPVLLYDFRTPLRPEMAYKFFLL
jgi:hypothetical protein